MTISSGKQNCEFLIVQRRSTPRISSELEIHTTREEASSSWTKMMSPVSFVFSFLFAVVNAASMPTCIKDYSSNVLPFGISHILNYTTQFCAHITSSSYSSNFRSYGMDSTLLSIVTLDFTSGTAGCSGNTTAANCEDVYRDLLSGCEFYHPIYFP